MLERPCGVVLFASLWSLMMCLFMSLVISGIIRLAGGFIVLLVSLLCLSLSFGKGVGLEKISEKGLVSSTHV